MKLKFKPSRESLIKIGCILILIAVSPFAMELILVVDVFGVEFAVSFMFLYLATLRDSLVLKMQQFKGELREFVMFLSALYMFEPKVFLSHATASGVLVAVTCSVFFTCLFWLPVIYASAGLVN